MVPKVVGSSPIFHPKRPSSEGFFYNTQITTHLSFRVHPEKGNIPEFCQDIKPRNRDLQSPNKPHTFAITVFENKEYDKYRPLWKLAPIKSRNRHFIEFWQTSRLAFRVPSAPYFRSEHINEKARQSSDYQAFSSVGVTRFELATTRPPDAYSTGLSYIPNCGCKSSALFLNSK